MIVFFSGTGNSRYCAEYLGQKLDDQVVDAFHFIRDGIAADLLSGAPWVFVAPTYGWRLPRVFEQFLRSGSFQGSTKAYFVMTCGNDVGDSPRYNRALCRDLGLDYMGTAEIVMPENYIALFSAPGREEAEKIISEAMPGLEKTAGLIAEEKSLPEEKSGAVDKIKSDVVNPAFYKLIIKAKPFYVTDSCIKCGKCAEKCVMGNITLEGGKPRWGERCTHCMACICSCPVEAIEYGRASRGKVRYQCPKTI